MSVISQRSVETMAHTDKAHSASTKLCEIHAIMSIIPQ